MVKRGWYYNVIIRCIIIQFGVPSLSPPLSKPITTAFGIKGFGHSRVGLVAGTCCICNKVRQPLFPPFVRGRYQSPLKGQVR